MTPERAAELQAEYAAYRQQFREDNNLPSGRLIRGEVPEAGEGRVDVKALLEPGDDE